jgi:hypothetical protein
MAVLVERLVAGGKGAAQQPVEKGSYGRISSVSEP